MEKSKVINVVHLHTFYKVYRTGIDRYLDMFAKGISDICEYSHIHSHAIYFTDDKSILFPRVNIDKDSEVIAIIPFPQKDVFLQKNIFWKKKYIQIVIGLLSPYLNNIDNLVFQYHNLYLADVAAELKSTFGGYVVTHLHCIPWKFNILTNNVLFRRLYILYQARQFDIFKEEEKLDIDFNVSDKIICLSEAAKHYIMNVHGVSEQKIHIIPNGLMLQTNTIRISEKKKKNIILYVGKVCKDKGVYELLNALMKVRYFKFEIILAGTCSPIERQKINNLYKKLKVQCLGQVSFEKLQELYSTCTIGIIPSLHEQCSYVALEMAYFGIPMIVSKVDALAEMFEHEKTALLTPLIFDPDFGLKHEEESFVENLVRLLKEKKLRDTLSDNVQKLYFQNFSLDIMMKKTIKLYNSLF